MRSVAFLRPKPLRTGQRPRHQGFFIRLWTMFLEFSYSHARFFSSGVIVAVVDHSQISPPPQTELPGSPSPRPARSSRRKPVAQPTPVRVSRGTARNRPATPQPQQAAAPARARAARRAADRHRPVRDRHRGPERESAPRGAPRSAICCSPSPASPDRASRPAHRAGRSFAGSMSTASASWRTASAPAACRISARTISCRSIRWRPTRSR